MCAKLISCTSFLCVLSIILIGNTASAQQPPRAEPPEQPFEPPEKFDVKLPELLKVKPVKIVATDGKLQRLLKERYNTMVVVIQEHVVNMEVGLLVDRGRLIADARDLVNAGLELNQSPQGKIALLQKYADFLKEEEEHLESAFKEGIPRVGGDGATKGAINRIRYHRLDAEIRIERLRLQQQKK